MTHKFAIEMYRQIAAKQKGNFSFSPYSVHVAMSMTLFGATGVTRDELCNGLNLPQDKLVEAVRSLTNDNIVRSAEYEITTATAMWGQSGLAWSNDFLISLSDIFHCGLQEADFATHPDTACDKINEWVTEKTGGKITDFVPYSAIDNLTRLILTNAIYFKGAWVKAFLKDQTVEGDFIGIDRTVKVPLMNQTARMQSLLTDRFATVLLPYKGYALSMLLIVPHSPDGLPAVEGELTTELVSTTIKRTVDQRVMLTLPRFKEEFGDSLKEALSGLGIKRAFSAEAEFPNIAPGLPLKISDVRHKAFVETNEEGTEAAAATAGIMKRLSIIDDKSEPLVVRADKPFLFAIINNTTQYPLFMGRIVQF